MYCKETDLTFRLLTSKARFFLDAATCLGQFLRNSFAVRLMGESDDCSEVSSYSRLYHVGENGAKPRLYFQIDQIMKYYCKITIINTRRLLGLAIEYFC